MGGVWAQRELGELKKKRFDIWFFQAEKLKYYQKQQSKNLDKYADVEKENGYLKKSKNGDMHKVSSKYPSINKAQEYQETKAMNKSQN